MTGMASFQQLLGTAAPGGAFAVQALLDPDDTDLRLACREYAFAPHWRRGFAIFSRPRIAAWQSERDHDFEFRNAKMPINLPKRPEPPHGAHTVRFAEGSRRTVNGLRRWLPDTLPPIPRAAPHGASP